MTTEQIDVEQETHWTVENGSWNRLVQHALDTYPKEACGILFSRPENPRHIREVYPAKNVSPENQARRYLVDPLEYLAADKWAEEQGLDICGFYHSHPDHPSAPSEYDGKMAWEGYLYLILSIKGRKFQDARAWIYDSDEEHFNEVVFKPHPLEPLHQDPSHHQKHSG